MARVRPSQPQEGSKSHASDRVGRPERDATKRSMTEKWPIIPTPILKEVRTDRVVMILNARWALLITQSLVTGIYSGISFGRASHDKRLNEV